MCVCVNYFYYYYYFLFRSTSIYFRYGLQVQSINPKSGPLTGGTEIQISGKGFSTKLGDITVTIGNQRCDVIHANYSAIKCVTPSSDLDGNADVAVS